ncbi:MAG: glycoside hydrolase [Bacteroidetes bacterium]|nr:MAG: glycoside hydrolase [Bacteroidota bacterium]
MVKNLCIPGLLVLLLASCSSTKSIPSGNTYSSRSENNNNNNPTFIKNVSVTPGSYNNSSIRPTSNTSSTDNNITATGIENYSALQFKYAIITNSTVEQMQNVKLLQFMDEWYGTPYHFGGTTRDGIDCSAFASTLMSVVYGVSNLPRIAKDQYNQCTHIQKSQLKEGDLVFFHTMGRSKSVTHVGIFLCNSKFVHASVSGVLISDMQDPYYSKHYIGAGRVLGTR